MNHKINLEKMRDQLVMEGTDYKQQIVEKAEILLTEINWSIPSWHTKLIRLRRAIREFDSNQEELNQVRHIIKALDIMEQKEKSNDVG